MSSSGQSSDTTQRQTNLPGRGGTGQGRDVEVPSVMSEVDEFLAAVLPLQHEADTALHTGDAKPRKALWSHIAPVTVFGAAKTVSGWAEVEQLFDWLAGNFSNCQSYDCEVIAAGASGDLGYVVGHERTTASVAGGQPTPYELRVTLIFRREGEKWKEVHRHADPWPETQGARQQLNRFK
jgi:ketosteroid isomerase-like protein